MSTANTPKGTAQMATRNPIQTTDAPTLPTHGYQWPTLDTDHDPEYLVTNDPADTERTTLAAFDPVARYEAGDMVWQIADDLAPEADTVARQLRRAGVLKPFDDSRALAHLYDEHDHTLESLAALFDHARGPESIRSRMDKYGISRGQTPSEKLSELNPEDLGLSPMGSDDSDSQFSKRGGSA